MTKIFADGFYFDRREQAPDFVVGRMSVKVEKAIAFLNEHANDRGYVNLNVLKSNKEGYYVELDQWKPKTQEVQQVVENSEEDTPF